MIYRNFSLTQIGLLHKLGHPKRDVDCSIRARACKERSERAAQRTLCSERLNFVQTLLSFAAQPDECDDKEEPICQKQVT